MELRYEARPEEGWEPVEASGSRDRFSRDRADLYNRLLRIAQRARPGRYATAAGGERNVFFDDSGRKHVMELFSLTEHRQNVRRPGQILRFRVVLLDELVVCPADGSLERLTHRWDLPERSSPWEAEALGRAFESGLESLEEGPGQRTVFRRSGNHLSGFEMFLAPDGQRNGNWLSTMKGA
ncbi:MAG: hypothetical protein AB1758_35930 [Candidatus Eremiobacterota bacterium]